MQLGNRCDDCEHEPYCDLAYFTNFCEDCTYCENCDLRTVQCKAGHDIECNNGFEERGLI
jgi:hypothetical protein